MNYPSHNFDALKIAEYFLCQIDEDFDEKISKLKLQKLLYYSQGFVLALTGAKLFNNRIEAWQHGPVVVDVYQHYKDVPGNELDKPENCDLSCIESNEEIQNILNEVYEKYGQFSAWKLREMTHDETPWLNTNLNEEITDELMMEFFSTKTV